MAELVRDKQQWANYHVLLGCLWPVLLLPVQDNTEQWSCFFENKDDTHYLAKLCSRWGLIILPVSGVLTE